MRVVAVTPNWNWDRSPLPTDTLRPPVSPPLEWAYLATGLAGGLTDCVDAYAADLSQAATVARVLVSDPEVVVVSTAASILYWRCPPFSVKAPVGLIAALRAAGFDGVVVLVGPHGTHSPAWTAQQSGADVIWRGSSDVTLAAAIESGALRVGGSGTASIRGAITVDSAADLPLADLTVFESTNHYPPHAWSLSEDERRILGTDSRGVLLEASRGCPWACVYCAKGPVRDRYQRRRIDLVKSEIDTAARLGFGYVFFIDETFNIPSGHLDAVLSAIKANGLTFGFQGRPDLIDQKRAQQLADAGCIYVELGVDIVGNTLSRDMGRGQLLNAAEDGVAHCRDQIPIVRFNRLNMSTLDYFELYPHDRSLNWDIPVDPIYPYPGAPLGAALMARYGKSDFDWDFAEQYSWWLRIEVLLQRKHAELDAKDLKAAQSAFMSMPKEIASVFAHAAPENQLVGGIHELNKAVQGVGGELHLRHSGV